MPGQDQHSFDVKGVSHIAQCGQTIMLPITEVIPGKGSMRQSQKALIGKEDGISYDMQGSHANSGIMIEI